jgi:hypothetical protein
MNWHAIEQSKKGALKTLFKKGLRPSQPKKESSEDNLFLEAIEDFKDKYRTGF